MLLKAVFFFVVLKSMVSPYPFVPDKASLVGTWRELEELLPKYKDKDTTPLSHTTPYPLLNLPQFQQISSSDIHQLIFQPARDYRPVPDVMKSILLPTTPPPTTPLPSKQKNIELLCHLDRIYVRVAKHLFTNPDAKEYLKVGNCSVNEDRAEHYYFLYPINSCNVQRQDNVDYVSYSNTLTYETVTTEPVVRELPFSVPLECRYSKYFRSYSVGFYPQVEAGTVYLHLHGGVSIKPVDVNWEPLGALHTYTIGEPMYFVAKAPSNDDGKRLYLSKCYITATQDPNATPKYTVVDNYGCMVDSKNTPQSKFYACADKTTLRFSVAALVFKDMVSQDTEKMEMFIHCELAMGPEMATPSTKSCSYDVKTQSWSEVHGEDSVCACCDTSCPAPDPSVNMKIASNSWKVKSQSQPASKLRKEALAHGGFEAFWDSFYETMAS